MREGTVKIESENPRGTTRRDFLKASITTALACSLPTAPGHANAEDSRSSGYGLTPPDYAPNWLEREPQRSRIVDVSSESVLQASVINPTILSDMLEQGVRNLTAERTTSASWRMILGDARKIAIKFNSVGANTIKMNDPLALVLVAQLVDAGYDRSDLALVEIPEFIHRQTGTGAIPDGWLGEILVGDELEPAKQYLSMADAIINVPLVKTHQIAGMSCCMKNLSHASIRHPARFHSDGCNPYVAQVISNRAISSRLKLNIVNALRIVIDHGPDARAGDILDYKTLLFGFDPLALDSMGMSILEIERRKANLPPAINVRYLTSAAEMKLGRWRAADIERTAVKVDR